MALYEHIIIARQDISPQQAEALNDTLKNLIEELGGHVAKIEYWGLRNLTYRIKKNRKGHYSLLALDAPSEAVKEMERQLSINEDVTVNDQLASLRGCTRNGGANENCVETHLEELNQVLTGQACAAAGFLERDLHLRFADTVLGA